MNDLLRAHPDLVAELDPDATRVCSTLVRQRHGGVSWRCEWLARWQVQGHPDPQCTIHAARTLRRELQDRTEQAGGS